MQLHYKVLGDGSPLIILHGLFGMLDNWQTLGRRFAQDFKVYLVDQRNHGKSPHDISLDYYVMADDLADFFEQHQLSNAAILGHSMGGKTAMQFAVDHPDLVSKLILVDIAPRLYPAGHDDVFAGFFAVPLQKISNRKQADSFLATKIDALEVRQFLLKNLNRQKNGTYRWKCNLEIIYQNYQAILESSLGQYDQFEGEALFIKGGESSRYVVPERDFATIQQHFPKAILQTIPDAGHWVHAEQPEALYQMVYQFLNH